MGSSALLIFFGFGAMAAFQFHGVLMEQDMGLSPETIGYIFMLGALSSMTAPLIVTAISSIVPNPNLLLSTVFFVLSGIYIIFPYLREPYLITLVFMMITLLVSLVFNVGQTNIQIATQHIGSSYFLFLRAIATLGFAISCFLSSKLSEYYSLQKVYLLFSLFSVIALFFSFKNLSVIPHQVNNHPLLATLKNTFTHTMRLMGTPNTVLVILLIFIASISANMGSTLIGNFVTNELDGSNASVGTAWYIATFAEVPFILLSIVILKRFDLKILILTGMAVLAIRMWLIYESHTLTSFYIIQLLHGVFYGSTLAGTSIYFKRMYGDKNLHFIQVYSGMIIAGLGGAAAGRINGYLWEHYDLRTVYITASALACIAFFGFLFFVKIPREKEIVI